MTKAMTLAEAINALDPARDEDWTANGEPAMARVEELTGNPDLKRADVRAATPEGFNRSNAHAAPTQGDANAATNDPQTSAASSDAGAATGADAVGGDTSAVVEGEAGAQMSDTAKAVAELIEGSFDGEDFNAVTLMEAVVAAAQSDRYVRNSALQNLVRGYQVSQAQIKDVQGRLDARIADRKAKNAASRAATAAEAEG